MDRYCLGFLVTDFFICFVLAILVLYTVISVYILALFVVASWIVVLVYYVTLVRRDRATSLDPATTSGGSTQRPKRGLTGSVISRLPKFVYRSSDGDGNSRREEVMECSICLGTVDEEATIRMLPSCMHMFHVECIDVWLGRNTTCPICRTEVQPVGWVKHYAPNPRAVQPSQPPIIHESAA